MQYHAMQFIGYITTITFMIIRHKKRINSKVTYKQKVICDAMNASNHRYDKSEFGYNQLTRIFVLALINTYFVIVAMTIGAKMLTKIQKNFDT